MESRRLSSNREIYKIINNTRDFYKRSHNLTPIKAMYHLAIALLIALFFTQSLSGVSQASFNHYKLENILTSIRVINFLFIVLVIVTSYLIYKIQRMILVSEFQNLLFSSAMREKSLFCIIFSKSHVVYADQNDFFNGFTKFRDISHVLDMLSIEKQQKDEIIQNINKNSGYNTQCKKGDDLIDVEIISMKRPLGFFLIRGIAKQ